MAEQPLKEILEAVLLAAGKPLNVQELQQVFPESERPERDEIQAVMDDLIQEYNNKVMELREVGSGYRFQVCQKFAPWVGRLWEEKPPRYSRALMETLAIIAYRQPVTRAEIEDIRGVAVSTTIIKTLQEREWVKVVGHRDVPGRPAMYGSTREFLDYFNLKTLAELPSLAELRDLDLINAELDLDLPPVEQEDQHEPSSEVQEESPKPNTIEKQASAEQNGGEGEQNDVLH